jgi:hypothetical protein
MLDWAVASHRQDKEENMGVSNKTESKGIALAELATAAPSS